MTLDEDRAAMSSSMMDDLPDEAFAHVEPGGKKDAKGKTTPRSLRHYPVHDKAHADNALARANAAMKKGGDAASIAQKALPKIKAAVAKFGKRSQDETGTERDQPTSEDYSIKYGLADLKGQLAQLKAAQLSEPDNKDDPDDEAVSSALDEIDSAIDKAIVAQGKDKQYESDDESDDMPNYPVMASATKRNPALKKRGQFEGWGVHEGIARHGEVAVRMATDAQWELREAAEDDDIKYLGQLAGHFAVFDRWTKIDNPFEGRFMERMAPGAFTKTFAENKGIRCLFQHGKDPSVGMKPLGPIRELGQDDHGAHYLVDLLDTSYNRDLEPGIRSGQFGASFRFAVLREDVDPRPARSEHNPDGIEERTIKEAMVREFGPVTFGAYAEATAGMRSLNEELFDLDMGFRSLDPEAASTFLNHLRAGSQDDEETDRQAGVNVETEETDVETDVQTDVETSDRSSRTPTAPSTEAPVHTTSRRRYTTLTSSAAKANLRTTRKNDQEAPTWKL